MPKTVHHIEWHELDKRKYYFIGPSLFLGIRLLAYPPLLIKTRIQVQKQTAVYGSIFDASRKIWKHEGIRGFYRGFLVNAFGLISGQAYITTYELTRSYLSEYSNFTRGCISGVCASLAGQTVTVPIDVITQNIMVQGPEFIKEKVAAKKEQSTSSGRPGTGLGGKSQVRNVHTTTYLALHSIKIRLAKSGKTATDISKMKLSSDSGKTKNTMKGAFIVIREIFKRDGIFGFYRGYVASLLTYAPGSGIWWGSYGLFTRLIGELAPDDTPHMMIRCFCGPLAGVVASTATNPIDVIRTRLQVQGGTIKSVAQLLYKEEGLRALHKGLSARILSSMPTSCLVVIGYETTKRLSLKDEYREKYALLDA